MDEHFHAERRMGLGGSDLGAILGLSRYRTPYEVWLEKTGRAEPFVGNLQTRFGSYAEQFVADEYCRETGRRVQRYNTMLRHPQAPLIGHVDRLVVPDGRKVASHQREIRTDLGLEAKTAHALATSGDEWGEAGTDQVPDTYLIQCATYMALSGCQRWDLAALFGNSDFRIYHLHRDAELEDALLGEADRWWTRHVIADTPPDPSSEAEARQRWTRHRPGKVVTLDHGEVERLRRLAAIKAEVKNLEADAKDLRNHLVPLFADADELHDAEGNKLGTYRANKDSRCVDYRELAEHLLSTMEIDEDDRAALIAAYTTTKPGPRVLRLAKDLEKAA